MQYWPKKINSTNISNNNKKKNRNVSLQFWQWTETEGICFVQCSLVRRFRRHGNEFISEGYKNLFPFSDNISIVRYICSVHFSSIFAWIFLLFLLFRCDTIKWLCRFNVTISATGDGTPKSAIWIICTSNRAYLLACQFQLRYWFVSFLPFSFFIFQSILKCISIKTPLFILLWHNFMTNIHFAYLVQWAEWISIEFHRSGIGTLSIANIKWIRMIDRVQMDESNHCLNIFLVEENVLLARIRLILYYMYIKALHTYLWLDWVCEEKSGFLTFDY